MVMFEVILFGLVALCATIILLCKFVLKVVPENGSQATYISEHEIEPWYLDYARSFFPVLLIVFLLRGFVAEPFRIPSGSMLPTLEVGDFILVNKFKYGIRLPILHTKIMPIDNPQRGDIMVFRYPRDNKTHFIKRVIGLPGDLIEYRNKRLSINSKPVANDASGSYVPFSSGSKKHQVARFSQFVPVDEADSEQVAFSILVDNLKRSRSFRAVVPAGHYFMMGDNRDNSQDSRSWGFVPGNNIVGEAFFVWFHWNSQPGGGIKLSRVGEEIQAN